MTSMERRDLKPLMVVEEALEQETITSKDSMAASMTTSLLEMPMKFSDNSLVEEIHLLTLWTMTMTSLVVASVISDLHRWEDDLMLIKSR